VPSFASKGAGFVNIVIMRDEKWPYTWWLAFLKMMSRISKVGGRTLVYTAEGGDETYRQDLNNCKVGKQIKSCGLMTILLMCGGRVSSFVTS